MECFKDVLFRRVNIYHIICLGLLLRVVGLIQTGYIRVDGTIYVKIGESFSRGAFAEAFRGAFPPVYPFFIGLFHLLIPDLELAGNLVSFVFGVILIYIVFVFVKKFFGSQYALVASFFVAIHPFLVRNSVTVLSESVATFLFALSVFFYYRGWTEEQTGDVALSGFFLGLTYLTRPEYVVYAFPMVILLLYKKRFSQSAIFLLCFLVFVIPYIVYLKAETGQWVLSQKAILVMNRPRAGGYSLYLFPIPPISAVFRRIPFVAFHFFEAIFLPFFILVCLGWRNIDKRYRLLMVLLTFFHIASIATQSSSTVRFSVEFVPVVIPFAVAGFYKMKELLGRYRFQKGLYYSAIVIIVVSSLAQGFIVPDKSRLLHKQAGLYLKERDPGRLIASRLPLAPFYGKGEWVVISPKVRDCSQLLAVVREKDADYLVVDEKLEKAIPESKRCMETFPMVGEYHDGRDSVKIYRLRQDE